MKTTCLKSSLMIITIFCLFSFIVQNSLFSQVIPDATIEDAPVEPHTKNPANQSASETTNQTVDDQKNKTTFESRLFSIGTFSYQPVNDATHIAAANGLFEEKSASALVNFELIVHPEHRDKKTTSTLKVDVEGSASSLYKSASPFYEKNAGDWIRLDELFWEISLVPSSSFLIGKYRHIFTPGLFQNPLDRLNPTSTLPGEPAQREGAWIAELSFDGEFKSELLSRYRLSFAFLPAPFQDKSGLPVNARTVPEINTMSRAGFSFVTQPYNRDYMGGFARLYLDFFKGDFNIIYYYTEKQQQGGFSYSRYFLNSLEWHGEILFYEKPHSSFVVADKNAPFYADALTGLRYDVSDTTSLTLEYLYRQENPESYPAGLVDQSRLWLGQLGTESTGHALTPMRHYIIASFMSVNIKDIFDVAFNVISNPFDNEYLLSLRTDIKLDKASKLSLAGTYKIGDSTSFYGNFLPFDYQLRAEYYIALF
ncbi:MAG: hypothetical protein OEV66_04200 [Spirochaetia bacterium]|nr:hypothetical protein [Spirochaetia bacterium]